MKKILISVSLSLLSLLAFSQQQIPQETDSLVLCPDGWVEVYRNGTLTDSVRYSKLMELIHALEDARKQYALHRKLYDQLQKFEDGKK